MAPTAHRLLLTACLLALARAASLPPALQDPAPISVPAHEAIPVRVLVENVEPSVEADEVSDEREIHRPQVDLRNPGPPQRQEHETQNPENHHEDDLRVASVKQNIEQTRILLKEGFRGVSEDIRNWSSADDRSKIQSNLQNFRSMFAAQIKKLDDELHALAGPVADRPQIKSEFNVIESHLRILQDNFNNGVDTLSAGVNLVGALKSGQDQSRQESSGAAPPADTAAPAPPEAAQNPVQQIWNSITDGISNSFSNTVSQVQSFLGGLGQPAAAPPAGAQSDQAPSTQAPFQFTLPSFIPTLPALPNQPVLTALTNFNQGVQSFLSNLIPQNNAPAAAAGTPAASPAVDSKPTEVKKPAEKPEVSVAAAPAPVDKPAAPAPTAAPQADAPQAPAAAQPAAAPPAAAAAPPAAAAAPQPSPTPAPEGPIRQILNNNPVVQSIQSAVQRITNSIANPEKPRETEDKKDPAAKGGFYGKPPHNGSGNNNDISDSGLNNVHQEEVKPVPEDTQKEEEVKPVAVPEKTE